MTDITELTAEKLEEIRQRYRPTLAPKCHICGVEMTIQRMSASRITYGCTGAIYDETGCHYAEGRSLADDHYAESRITVVDVSDPDVLAMVEALEKVQRMESYWKTQCRGITDHCEELQARIAELESRTVTVKLPQRLQPGADGWDDWYVHSDDEGEYLKFDDVLAMLTAAGIKWEAE
ncbi:TPA: ead/Ea22-like family protein [Klebsiella pneumoniae]|nr:ead/Ea22-like family protein [Klebsiella pneumoniae]